jgi:agmatinase
MNNQQGFYAQPRNFAGLFPPYGDFDTATVAILPVPYDSTTEWHSGTRNGPKAIIEASYYLEWYDIELGREIHTCGIHTLPELEPAFNSPEAMNSRVYQATRDLLGKSKFVVMLGGEHSISPGAVRAHQEKYPGLSVLQLDAHTDLRDQYLGTKFSHACAMRRIIEFCPVTQVGIRAISLEEIEYVKSHKLHPFYFEINHRQLPLDEIAGSLSENVYVTIDLDVFDPSIMSAVGTPEPGGMLWQPVLDLLRHIAGKKKIVGFDVVELCPDQGPASCAFTAAKLVYKLIGYSCSKR